jgi:hypothetical protein
VGTERQWSGHASGPHARFAGLRTFTMLGALAGISGWFWTTDARAIAVVLLAGAAALIAIGYARASRVDIDGTTEVAAIVVLAAGVLAGMGQVSIAMGITAITVLLLIEKHASTRSWRISTTKAWPRARGSPSWPWSCCRSCRAVPTVRTTPCVPANSGRSCCSSPA